MAPGRLAAFFLLNFLLLVGRSVAQNGPTQWTPIPFNPPSIPLAVKSPYLNSWNRQGNGAAPLSTAWSSLWTTSNITGWYGAVTVDGIAYRFLGDAGIVNTTATNQTAASFTPTRSSFLLQAGPVQLNASFLNPITPTDLVRQSLPFSYMYVTAQSTDGQQHAVKIYSDISGEFISGDDSLIMRWDNDVSGSHVILHGQMQTPQPFTDLNNHAQDSSSYYSMRARPGLTWQIGEDVVVRTLFSNTSALANSTDTQFRAVSDRWPVLGIAVDMGQVGSTPTDPAVWSIGIVRNPSIQYRGISGQIEARSAYYWSNFATPTDVVDFVLSDFTNALSTSIAFDSQLQSAGSQINSDYSDLLTLSALQVLSSVEITLPTPSQGGGWNTSDVKSFMKNLGSVGSSAGVNAVDTLYASFPIYLYLNPDLAGFLLRPLLEYQSGPAYSQPYAAQDLGVAYPVATGNNSQHNFGIEESANMIIMALAHAQASGNGDLISQHFNLLQGWADYLVNTTLFPGSQFSADDTSTNLNKTNLAVKGIIGIGAMAKICDYAKLGSQQNHYDGISKDFMNQWASLTISLDKGHLLTNYGNQVSSGLLYNLFADKLLQLNLVPSNAYQIQQTFYGSAARQLKYGLPLDNTNPQNTRSDWMMFAAATVDDQTTQNLMINQLRQFVSANLDNFPFGAEYDPTTGHTKGGVASPGQGAMFSLLAARKTIKSPQIIPNSLGAGSLGSGRSKAGAIAGGVVAALVGLSAIGAAFFFWRRRKLRMQSDIHYIESEGKGSSHITPLGLSEGTTFEPFQLSGSHGQSSTTSINGHLMYNPGGRMSLGGGVVYSPTATSDPEYDHNSGGDWNPGHLTGRSMTFSELGPSASQVGGPTSTATTSSVSNNSRTLNSAGISATASQGHRSGSSAKQSMVNDELRSEVENLRREMERIREERVVAREEAPPSYNELNGGA